MAGLQKKRKEREPSEHDSDIEIIIPVASTSKRVKSTPTKAQTALSNPSTPVLQVVNTKDRLARLR